MSERQTRTYELELFEFDELSVDAQVVALRDYFEETIDKMVRDFTRPVFDFLTEIHAEIKGLKDLRNLRPDTTSAIVRIAGETMDDDEYREIVERHAAKEVDENDSSIVEHGSLDRNDHVPPGASTQPVPELEADGRSNRLQGIANLPSPVSSPLHAEVHGSATERRELAFHHPWYPREPRVPAADTKSEECSRVDETRHQWRLRRRR